MTKLVKFIIISFVFSLFATPSFSVVFDNGKDEKPAFAANQLIVKFNEGVSPDQLQQKIQQKEAVKQTLWGKITVFFEELKLKLKGEEKPEETLEQIKQIEEKAGVVDRDKIFKNGDSFLINFYLYKTDGSASVTEAVELFQTLPEVESAEPNYIQRIQKMGI